LNPQGRCDIIFVAGRIDYPTVNGEKTMGKHMKLKESVAGRESINV